jgi:hypothetical protein
VPSACFAAAEVHISAEVLSCTPGAHLRGRCDELGVDRHEAKNHIEECKVRKLAKAPVLLCVSLLSSVCARRRMAENTSAAYGAALLGLKYARAGGNLFL